MTWPFVRRSRYTFLLEQLRIAIRQRDLLQKDLIGCITHRDDLLKELERARDNVRLLLQLADGRPSPALFRLGDDEALKNWPTKGKH